MTGKNLTPAKLTTTKNSNLLKVKLNHVFLKKSKSHRKNLKQNDISVLVKKKQPSFFRNSLKEPKTMILIFDSVAYWIFPVESHLHKTKCQIDTFHEVLPGNLVFFHFYCFGTTEIEILDHATEFYVKNYISV